MIVDYDQESKKLFISVINKKVMNQLLSKASFEIIEKTDRHITGFISLEDLVFDL